MQMVTRDWSNAITNTFSQASHSLTLCAPYIQLWGIHSVLRCLSGRTLALGSRSLLLTDLSTESMLTGSTEPRAILRLMERLRGLQVVHLPCVHAKVYIADDTHAIVGSANLSRAGLTSNYEYGVMFNGAAAREAARDIREYAALGSPLDVADVKDIAAIVDTLRRRLPATPAFQSAAAVDPVIATGMQRLGQVLIDRRVSSAAPNSVIARTILYVLRRHGPSTTEAIHRRVKSIHPDLCDDRVDRVIGGVSFGKLWKHAVRNSQQALKRKGAIVRVHGRWQVAAHSGGDEGFAERS